MDVEVRKCDGAGAGAGPGACAACFGVLASHFGRGEGWEKGGGYYVDTDSSAW